MSNAKLHVFVTVVVRRYNPFYGLLEELKKEIPNDAIEEIYFNEYSNKKIMKVEYSWRKRYRFIYYSSIAKELKAKIRNAVNKHKEIDELYLYISDEGVWSEIVKDIFEKIKVERKSIVMVQHGLHYIEEAPKSLLIRKAINAVLRFLIGFPCYGYGFIGSKLDKYLVYSTVDSDFIKNKISKEAFSCPKLIKNDFIREFSSLEKSLHSKRESNGAGEKVLFAMEPVIPSSGVSCDEKILYESMAYLFNTIALKMNSKIIFRPHPGMDYNKSLELIKDLSYSDLITVDGNSSLNETLVNVDFVLSLHSTVLYDAGLIGKVPVQIINQYEDRRLHIAQEIIDTREVTKEDVDRIFSSDMILSYKNNAKNQEDDICWSRYVASSI